MGESLKAEVTAQHGAVPMVAAPTPVPLNKRAIPRTPAVTFETTLLPSVHTRAHGNLLFLLQSTAVDAKKQETFKPLIADFAHPVETSFQVYHAHAGLILGKHPPIPAVVTVGVQTAPDVDCMSELGDYINQLAKRLAKELVDDPIGFYSNFTAASDAAAMATVGDKASGIWEGVKSIGGAIGDAATAVYNDPLGTASAAGEAVYGFARDTVVSVVGTVEDAYELGKALYNGEISFQDILDEVEAALTELMNELGCAGRDLVRDMVNNPEPVAKQLGTAVGAAKAGIAMEVLEGVLVSKGLGTVAKIAVKLGPLTSKLERLSPKKLLERVKAKAAARRAAKTKPAPTDKPAPAPGKPGSGPDTSKQGQHESVDKGKNDPNKKPCPGSGKPVNPILGCKMLFDAEDLDFTLPSAMPLIWQRQYFSDIARTGWFGQGWTLGFFRRFELGRQLNAMIDDQGRRVEFARVDAGRSDYNRWDKLTCRFDPDAGYIVAESDGTEYRFGHVTETTGSALPLRAIRDRNGNLLHFYYSAATGLPTHLIDAAGHIIVLSFITVGIGDGEAAQLLRWRLSEVHLARAIPIEHAADTTLPPRLEFRSLARLARYEYDSDGQLIAVHNRLNEPTRQFAYRDRMLVMHRDAAGLECHYEYDRYEPRGRVLRHWTNEGSQLVFTYDPTSGRSSIVNERGESHVYLFDVHHRYIGDINALGGLRRYCYDSDNNLIETIDELGRSTRFSYDPQGNLTSVTDAAGQRQSLRNDRRLNVPLEITDVLGQRWRYGYDTHGNLIEQTNPLGHTTRYRYDPRGLLVEITDAKGGTNRLTWNDSAQLTTFTDCSQRTTHYSYDSNEQLTRVDDVSGLSTHIQADPLGRPHAIEHPNGSTERFAYDRAGRLVGYRDANGSETHYRLNLSGLPVERRDALGHTLRYDYDRGGRLIGLQNENHAQAYFTYDALDRLTEETGFDGRRQRYQYNAAGELITRTDEGDVQSPSRHTHYERDVLGRLTLKTTASDRQRYRYDAAGQLIGAANAAAQLNYRYDALGQVIEENQRIHGPQGTPGTPGGYEHRLLHEYDELGNRTATTLSDGRQLNYLYYGSGHLHQINLDGHVISDIERDLLHREIERSQGALSSRYEYDALGRLTAQIALPRDETAGELWQALGGNDPRANLAGSAHSASQGGRGAIIKRQYRYDAAGQLLAIDDHHKGQTQYRYDPLGRLTDAQRAWSGPHGVRREHERFAFDPAHNLIEPQSQIRPHASTTGGPPESEDQRRERERQEWAAYVQQRLNDPDFNLIEAEALQHRQQRQNANRNGALLDNRLTVYGAYRYRYDVHGDLIEKKSGAHRIEHFEWDAEHQLIASTCEHDNASPKQPLTQHTRYGYDALGRRVWKASYSQSHLERLTYFGWDGNRLVQECSRISSGTAKAAPLAREPIEHIRHTVYEPDSFVPLARIDEPTVTAELSDDIQQTPPVHPTPVTPQAALSTFTEHSEDSEDDLDDNDGELNLDPRRWMNLPPKEKHFAIRGLTSRLRREGERIERAARQTRSVRNRTAGAVTQATAPRILYYQCDHLGTPQELTDSNGHVVWSARYSAWGKVSSVATDRGEQRQASVEQPLRFQGQYHDEETGLHYNRFRYYDPDIGRFVSQDPIGYAGGGNLFQYAPNPTGWVDPLGLASSDFKANWAAAYGPRPSGYQVHHIIPKDAAITATVKSMCPSYDEHKADNLIALPDRSVKPPYTTGPGYGGTVHQGSHPGYSRAVHILLRKARTLKIPGMCGCAKVAALQNMLRAQLEKGGTDLNLSNSNIIKGNWLDHFRP